jgi:hypothetical protein
MQMMSTGICGKRQAASGKWQAASGNGTHGDEAVPGNA